MLKKKKNVKRQHIYFFFSFFFLFFSFSFFLFSFLFSFFFVSFLFFDFVLLNLQHLHKHLYNTYTCSFIQYIQYTTQLKDKGRRACAVVFLFSLSHYIVHANMRRWGPPHFIETTFSSSSV